MPAVQRPPSYKEGFYSRRRGGNARFPSLHRGLIGHWSMMLGPTGSHVCDWSGYGNNGTLNQFAIATDWVVTDKGYALESQGATGKWIAMGNPTLFQIGTGTIFSWFRTADAGSSYRGLIVKQLAYSIFFNGNTVGWYDWSLNTPYFTTATYNDNKWHCFALSFQAGVSNGTTLYIDGAAVLTGYMGINSQGVELQLFWSNFFGQDIDGQMLEAGLFNRVLSPGEHRTLALRPGVLSELAPSPVGIASAAPSGRRQTMTLLGV